LTAIQQRTLIDWLGFSTTLITAIMAVALGALVLFLPYQMRQITEFVLLPVGAVGIVFVVQRISVGRVSSVLARQMASAPPDALRHFRRELIAAVIGGGLLIGAASWATFALQVFAYDWFTSLLHP